MPISIPKPKKNSLQPPPSRTAPKITNLKKRGSKELVTLNLKVPAEFRRAVKLYATTKDLSMVEVLKRSFQAYKTQHR